MGCGETLFAVEYVLCILPAKRQGAQSWGFWEYQWGSLALALDVRFYIDTHGIIGNIRTRDYYFVSGQGICLCHFQMGWATRRLSNAIQNKIKMAFIELCSKKKRTTHVRTDAMSVA